MVLWPLTVSAVSSHVDERLAALAFTLAVAAFALKSAVTSAGPALTLGQDIGGTRVAVLPSTKDKVYLFLQGLGGSIEKSMMMPLVQNLNARGSVVLVERRGFGNLRHLDPCIESSTDDAAVGAMVACSIASEVVVVGFSLGASMALRLLPRMQFPTILVGGFFDARSLPNTNFAELLMTHVTVLSNESAIEAVPVDSRLAVVHSTEDAFIPHWQADRLARHLRERGCQVYSVSIKGGHGEPSIPDVLLDQF